MIDLVVNDLIRKKWLKITSINLKTLTLYSSTVFITCNLKTLFNNIEKTVLLFHYTEYLASSKKLTLEDLPQRTERFLP